MLATTELRALAVLAALLTGCGGGDSSSPPADPAPTPTVLARGEPAPGVRVAIVAITGGSGPGGFFRVGDRPSVRFTLTKADGSPWGLGEMSFARILLSGPSFDYQRVIPEQSDLATRAAKSSDGSFVYTFASGLPASYLPPYNDTTDFGAGDGELTGQALFDGTYTVGISLAWDYTIEGNTYHDVGEAVGSLLFGGSATLVEREVVKQANCNACHLDLRAHGGQRKDIRVCILCHTQGAEDLNDPGIALGTPGVSISSRILFHKIHNGKHLPSVLGVSTLIGGARTYTATPQPFVVVDGESGAHDYSAVSFPVWPNRTIAMPRDFGWSALDDAAKAKDEEIRRGITRCDVCHGDPDGAGPLTEPAQGRTIYAEPTRAACGACHDDVLWDRRYDNGNKAIMEAQPDDTICRECHEASDDAVPSFSIRGGHEHPLVNTLLNPFLGEGIHLDVTDVVEAGAADGNGAFDPGEKIGLTLAITRDDGTSVNVASLASVTALLSGPTTNSNLVLESSIPRALLTGPGPFTLLLPERIELESLGSSTSAGGEVFTTQRSPHHPVTGAPTQVFTTGVLGAITILASDCGPEANFAELTDATGFARDDFVVLEPGAGGAQEFLRVQLVDANRIWFSSQHSPAYPAGPRQLHAAGVQVAVVSLTLQAQGADYAYDPVAGTITEISEFGNGAAVIASYTTDFVLPTRYPVPANGSPDLGESVGEWAGKALTGGLYRLTVSASRDFDYFAPGQTTRYRAATDSVSSFVQVGMPATLPPYDEIESSASCLSCHQQLYYHPENFRGYDTCIACHGNAGMEDRPQYVSANAPATPGVSTDFRSLLHAIHMGSRLPKAATYTVVGAGTAPYPDDFTAQNYQSVVCPAMPGGPAQCAKCHGATNQAWKEPRPRDHPDGQAVPTQVWRASCSGCHDGVATLAHMNDETDPGGVETCAMCHAVGQATNVELFHDVR